MSRAAEQVFTGVVASRGLAAGLIHLVIAQAAGSERTPGTSDDEHDALSAAIEQAASQLAALAAASDQAAAGILEFQIAMLGDEEFVAPAFRAIAEGDAAVLVWCRMLDVEIADYAEADDEYFRARAEDLADLRDRVRAALDGAAPSSAAAPAGAIYVAPELTPSRFLETDWDRFRGAALTGGSATSHVSMLARARGLPLLVGVDAHLLSLGTGVEAILDAEDGRLIVHPAGATADEYSRRIALRAAEIQGAEERVAEPARTADGTPVKVYLNINEPSLLERVDPAHCDGIGLTRTEFLFHDAGGLADEDTQYQAYARLVDWAAGRPVTIRTLDAGGDKPIQGLTRADERNPFLGVRGIRLSLKERDVFATQLRALVRAAARGPLKVMLPMVTVPDELTETRALLREAIESFERRGVEAAMPALGIMVEVPATALTSECFAADFLSIGSNDLLQYTVAASRDSADLAYLQDPLNPALMRLINRVAETAAQTGIEVSVCGDMASDPKCIGALLNAGIRALSIPPAALATTKATVAGYALQLNG